MKAMILAAGLGTRLRPLTLTKPKALVEYKGIPLLEWVLKRLIEASVTDVIINLHHFPQQIEEFLQRKNHFGIHIEFSYEDHLLNTGGGLKKASYFFTDDDPFILHNVDIISTIDLKKMVRYHLQTNSLVTLAVKKRQTERYLLFDEKDRLCGWKSTIENKTILVRKDIHSINELGFCGIHVISPQLFQKISEEGAFSIIQTYLRLAPKEILHAFRADDYEWQDRGR
jgi:NDP-sugar pyrophosphorylase family protein